MRLDQYLVQEAYFVSREKASQAIKHGLVKVNGHIVKKPSTLFAAGSVELLSEKTYVSRSAHKLKDALDAFQLNLSNDVVLDIGASTGGFTEVALEHGAKKVIAIDVGKNQMVDGLKNDPRVDSREETHILTIDQFESIDTVVCDVSFISSLTVLDHVRKTASFERILVLFKPQFESQKRLKNPVIKDVKLYQKIQSRYESSLREMGFIIQGSFPTMTGKKGNQEIMYYLTL